MDDSPAEIRKKIATATTDSGRDIRADTAGKPGISNLLLLYATVSGKPVAAIEKRYAGKGYAEFKRDLAEAVVKFLSPFQTAKRKVKKAAVLSALAAG